MLLHAFKEKGEQHTFKYISSNVRAFISREEKRKPFKSIQVLLKLLKSMNGKNYGKERYKRGLFCMI